MTIRKKTVQSILCINTALALFFNLSIIEGNITMFYILFSIQFLFSESESGDTFVGRWAFLQEIAEMTDNEPIWVAIGFLLTLASLYAFNIFSKGYSEHDKLGNFAFNIVLGAMFFTGIGLLFNISLLTKIALISFIGFIIGLFIYAAYTDKL